MAGLSDVFRSKSKKRKQEREFNVYINEDEMERIRQWVALRPNIETGGDLFGLWIDQHTAVVQFVLGPGKSCRRTYTSFFQDVSYLQDVGSYLTENHGLCNIGQWHSHHTIPLFEPSAGDNNTVWSNMPTLGIERYIVFIANIKSHEVTKKPSDVSVNCFLFEINDGKQLPVIQGSHIIVSGESPFRLNNDVMYIVRNKAEILTEGKKAKGVEEVSELSEESVGRKEETETALLPQEDQENEEKNSMPIPTTQSTDDKAVSVCDKNTPDVATGTSGFKDKQTVDSSKMGGTKNNSKVQKRNTSSNKITISSTGNEVRSSLVDNKTRTSTKTEIPTANDSNHDSSNNGEDNTKSEENKNSNENKMGESGKKNDNTSLNISNTFTNVTSTISNTSPNVTPITTNVTPITTNVTTITVTPITTNVTPITTDVPPITTSNTSLNVIPNINVTNTSTTLTPTQLQSQPPSNEQHSNNSLQQNATIKQHPSTKSESDDVNPKVNDKEQESTSECNSAVTTQPQSNQGEKSRSITSSQQSNPRCFILCCPYIRSCRR